MSLNIEIVLVWVLAGASLLISGISLGIWWTRKRP